VKKELGVSGDDWGDLKGRERSSEVSVLSYLMGLGNAEGSINSPTTDNPSTDFDSF